MPAKRPTDTCQNVFPNVGDILTQPNLIQSRLSCDYLIESPRILKTVL